MWLINVSFLQLPVRGRSCHPEHYMYVYKTWKRGTKPLSSLQQESWKTFFHPFSSSPFAPLSSPGWRVCPHFCWDNLLEYPDFPILICLKEINGHYCGQIQKKPWVFKRKPRVLKKSEFWKHLTFFLKNPEFWKKSELKKNREFLKNGLNFKKMF